MPFASHRWSLTDTDSLQLHIGCPLRRPCTGPGPARLCKPSLDNRARSVHNLICIGVLVLTTIADRALIELCFAGSERDRVG